MPTKLAKLHPDQREDDDERNNNDAITEEKKENEGIKLDNETDEEIRK